MGLLLWLAYAILGILSSLLFWVGVFVQAFLNLYFGIAITAAGALLHIVRELLKIYELAGITDKVALASHAESNTRNALWGICGGLLVLAAIWFFRGFFLGGTWLIFLVNQAAYTVISVVPALAKILLARAKM